MERNLILFFSRAGQNIVGDQIVELEQGNSEYVARLIQEAVGGTLFKIETREDYPEDYEKCLDVAKDEMRKRFRPELGHGVFLREHHSLRPLLVGQLSHGRDRSDGAHRLRRQERPSRNDIRDG